MNIHSIYRPFLRYYRRRRLVGLYHSFGISETSTIVDIGGNAFFWNLVSDLGLPRPSVTVVNLYAEESESLHGLRWVVADGRGLPFKDRSFDIAFCNSVIEHLGDWESQKQLAAEISRIATGYFVQTPSRHFPFEPHLLTPFVHWLPRMLRVHLLRNFTLWGLIVRPSQEQCRKFIDEVQLLTVADMQQLLPDGVPILERFCGIVKSIVLLRRTHSASSDGASSRLAREEAPLAVCDSLAGK